jgi:cysteinyl-tRNA synthetase
MSDISQNLANEILMLSKEMKSMLQFQQEKLTSLDERIDDVSKKINEIRAMQENEEEKWKEREEKLSKVFPEIKASLSIWKSLLKVIWKIGKWIYEGIVVILNVVTAIVTMLTFVVYLRNSH